MSTRARAMLAPSKTPIMVKLSSPASDLSTRYSRMIPLGVVGGVRVMSTCWAVLVMNGAGTPSGTANKEYCIISGTINDANKSHGFVLATMYIILVWHKLDPSLFHQGKERRIYSHQSTHTCYTISYNYTLCFYMQ